MRLRECCLESENAVERERRERREERCFRGKLGSTVFSSIPLAAAAASLRKNGNRGGEGKKELLEYLREASSYRVFASALRRASIP